MRQRNSILPIVFITLTREQFFPLRFSNGERYIMSMQNIASFALNNAFNVASNPAAGQAQQAAGSFMTGAQIFAQEASMYPPGSPYQDMLGSTAQIMAGVGQIANVGPILQSYQLRKQQEALLLGGLGGAGGLGGGLGGALGGLGGLGGAQAGVPAAGAQQAGPQQLLMMLFALLSAAVQGRMGTPQ